jgi:hypothetical protein
MAQHKINHLIERATAIGFNWDSISTWLGNDVAETGGDYIAWNVRTRDRLETFVADTEREQAAKTVTTEPAADNSGAATAKQIAFIARLNDPAEGISYRLSEDLTKAQASQIIDTLLHQS